jgi:hypothetical protein
MHWIPLCQRVTSVISRVSGMGGLEVRASRSGWNKRLPMPHDRSDAAGYCPALHLQGQGVNAPPLHYQVQLKSRRMMQL